MDRFESFLKMLRERRFGFMMDEVMTGTHHFVNGAGPEGEHPMSFRVTWGTRHAASYFNPFNPGFMSNWLEGTVTVGGLVYSVLGRVPKPGEELHVGGFRVVVEKVVRRRVQRVYFEREAAPAAEVPG